MQEGRCGIQEETPVLGRDSQWQTLSVVCCPVGKADPDQEGDWSEHGAAKVEQTLGQDALVRGPEIPELDLGYIRYQGEGGPSARDRLLHGF